MSAAGLAARAEVRRRWPAVLGLAVLVALVTGVVLATLAGARRSSTTVDRFLEATNARDMGVFAITLGPEGAADGPELVERIGQRVDALPGVTQTGILVGYPTGASEEFDVTVLASPDDSSHRTIDSPVLLDGRLPALTSSNEVAINDATADLLDVDVGDVIVAPTFSPDDCAALVEGAFLGFNGPLVELDVVGRFRIGDDLRGDEATSGPTAIASSPFIDEHGGDICSTVIFVTLRTAPGGPTTGEVQAVVDEETPGLEKGLVSTAEEDYGRTIRAAVDSVTTVLLLVAAVAAISGTIACAQAIRRQAAAGAPTGQSLGALGLSRTQRAVVVAAPSLVSIGVGVATGIGLAWLASSAFPPSVARAVEPDPGRDFDPAVLIGGCALIGLTGMAWSLVSARQAGDALRRASSTRPSRVVDVATRLGGRPPSLTGLRMAFESGPTSARVPSRSALAGAVMGVAGVVAVLVIVSSTDAAIAEPVRFGWNWSAMPDVEVEDTEAAIESLGSSGTIDAAARLVGGAVEVEGRRLQAHAIEDLLGSTELVIAEGRAPVNDREIALGGASMRDLGASIDDVVQIEDDEGLAHPLTVVGQAVLPIVNDTTHPGSGAALTVEALTDLTRGDTEDNVVVTYAPGVDPARAEGALSEQGFVYSGYADPQVPGRLLNLTEVRGVFVALAAFLALLGVVGLAHALIVSERRHRMDFAVLRGLGFLRREVRVAVWWQAAAIAIAACVIGVPLGFVIGRLGWRTVTNDLHMLEGISSPFAAAAVIAVAAVVLASVVAFVPATLAARRRPAALLRTE